MKLTDILDEAGRTMSRTSEGEDYARRHGVRSAPTLTVTTDETAGAIAAILAPRIRGTTVLDLGGGIGLLGLHLADYAARVFVIEANPLWAAAWVDLFHRTKPVNCSYLFGAANEFVGLIRPDVVTICTHSAVDDMMATGHLFSPLVIDVYGELIAANPNAFDPWAREARLK